MVSMYAIIGLIIGSIIGAAIARYQHKKRMKQLEAIKEIYKRTKDIELTEKTIKKILKIN